MNAPMSSVLLGLGSTTFLLQQVWITWFHWASLPSSVTYFLLKEMDLIDGLVYGCNIWAASQGERLSNVHRTNVRKLARSACFF
jgi:hypothetical protein